MSLIRSDVLGPLRASALIVILAMALPAFAQAPVLAQADHARLLASSDAKAAANKRLVYDFWREVFEGGHMELVDKYLAEDYIQHNPQVPTGRAGFVAMFSKFVKPSTIEARVKAPLVSILAEGDTVVLAFVQQLPDPKEPAKQYTSTWFDMFRIENGLIAEHWDAATK
jgi:predicted SnoaL-like aldol condensation-catalyzing enzyme